MGMGVLYFKYFIPWVLDFNTAFALLVFVEVLGTDC